MLSLIGLASLNLWTGGPLLALWIGSRTQGSGPPTMTGLLVVTIALLAVSLGLIRLIAALQQAYDKQQRRNVESQGSHPVAAKHAR